MGYRDDYWERRVLDLGVGAGRTTRLLSAFAADYVGTDVSDAMLATCRSCFPRVALVKCDIRALDTLAKREFDFVFASYNLLDAVSHAERLEVLASVRRLMAPQSLFAFSSHNRRLRRVLAGPRLRYSRNPVTQLRNLYEFLVGTRNHLRMRGRQRFEPDYALINDSAHDFLILNYYIDREAQTRQLEKAGFRLLEVYDRSGTPLSASDDDSECSELYYVVRRTE